MNGEQPAYSQEILPITKSSYEQGWMHKIWTLFQKRYEYFLIPVVVGLFLLGWQLIVSSGRFPEFVLPSPASVWEMFLIVFPNGELWFHTRVTLSEAFAGFGLGLLTASVLGYIFGRRFAMWNLISPYVIAAKSVNVLGIAPLFIIWFGEGIIAKALVAFMIIFFPMLVNTIIGIREVNEEQRELMRSYSASSWQVFTVLEIPSALPLLLGGMKIGLARSMMGAIVGEYLGANEGLGFIINLGTGGGMANPALTFLGIISIVIVTLLLYSSVGYLERVFLKSRQRDIE